MEGMIGTFIRKLSVSDSGVSTVSSSSAVMSPLSSSPGESCTYSGDESRSGSFTSHNNIRGKDTPLPDITTINDETSVTATNTSHIVPTVPHLKQRPQSTLTRPVIRITVEPVSSSEDESEGEGGSSIFLELSESGTGLSDKTLIEIDGLIDDCGIMVTCSEVEESGSSVGEDNDRNYCGDINESSYLETGHPQHKKFLGRVESSPNHQNLSDGSDECEREGKEENGEGGLKVEEGPKPKRRNTIADIFRW